MCPIIGYVSIICFYDRNSQPPFYSPYNPTKAGNSTILCSSDELLSNYSLKESTIMIEDAKEMEINSFLDMISEAI